MYITCIKKLALLFFLGCWLVSPAAFSASPNPDLQTAKDESEAKGLIFIASHEEIVANAKKEGKMHAVLSSEPATIDALVAAFKKKYPFLDVIIDETTGTDTNRRFLLEIKSGRPMDIDAIHLPTDMYHEFLPFMKRYDLASMATHGVIKVPIEVIDQANPFILAAHSNIQIVAYNKNLISSDQVPKTWEDFLKPQYKDKQFVVDIRPTEVAALVPAWGLEKVLDFARKIASQNPVWARGGTRTLTAMAVGEYALFMGPNYHTTRRAMKKDPTNSLGMVFIEPVPVRPVQSVGVLSVSKRSNAALLFMEFLLSQTGQKIADEIEPDRASAFFPGGIVNTAIKGKQLSVVTWETQQKLPEYQKKIVEAYGFPRADINRKKKK